jgi:hypothetical protein
MPESTETDPDLVQAYQSGDAVVARLKAAEAKVAELTAALAQAEASKVAAIAVALADLKAKIAGL